MTRRVLGTVAVDPRHGADSGWAAVRAVACAAGGPDSLVAARLALAVVELVGDAAAPAEAEVAVVTGQSGARVEAVVRGGAGSHLAVPAALVDDCWVRTSTTGAVEHVAALALDRPRPATPRDPPLGAPWDARHGDLGMRRLLAAALIAVEHQDEQLAASERGARELRLELDETSQGLLAIHAELSDQHDQLEHARAEAESASRAKAAFLATMSHEIRSPMNAVIGFTSLLLDTGLTAEQNEYAEAVRTAGRHLQDVVDDILDFSKIESGRIEIEETPFKLVACVEDAVSIVAPKADEKGLALASLFSSNTPDVVDGDPVRLRQILVNLLSNAVKFTDNGHVAVEVEANPLTAGHCRLTFHVRDTGIGIPADAIKRVFDPFGQADPSTTRIFGGTGLGLSICRQLSERMGGGITVESNVGEGSIFTCDIVVRLAAPLPLGPGNDTRLSGTKIVVIHEQPLLVDVICRHLSTWGARVVATPTIDDASRRAHEWRDATVAVLGGTRQSADLERGAELLATACGRRLPIVAVAPPSSRRSQLRSVDDVREVISTPIRRFQLHDAILGALGLRDRTHEPAHRAGVLPPNGETRAVRILLAEDNTMNQRAATLMLGRIGYPVDVVDDGEQAVAAILGNDYDLVLMDLHMPRLDGLAATRKARLARPGGRPRIVAMTASATDDNRRACLEAGMSDFLAKPVEFDDLARVVAETPGRPELTPTPSAVEHVGRPGHHIRSGAPGDVRPLQARRVLYVDDDLLIVKLVERILARDHDLELIIASDGNAAIELATAHQPDIILIDLHLPDMSGENLLRHLRADTRTESIPVIVISGDTSSATIERLTSQGAADYLTKPFNAANLRALVERHGH